MTPVALYGNSTTARQDTFSICATFFALFSTMANVAGDVNSSTMLNASPGGARQRRSVSKRNSTERRLTSSDRIRSDLFHKLGIDRAERNGTKSVHHIITASSARSLLGDVQVHHEPLKYENDEVNGQQKETRSRSNSWHSFLQLSPTTVISEPVKERRTRRLSFEDAVEVVPIPMRHDYSGRVRDRLWINADELELAAYRNAVEFTAEGWDWRTVTEDDGMYRCRETGEKIHPVHIEPQPRE